MRFPTELRRIKAIAFILIPLILLICILCLTAVDHRLPPEQPAPLPGIQGKAAPA